MAHPYQIEGCLIPGLIQPGQIRAFPLIRNRDLRPAVSGTLLYDFEQDFGDHADTGDTATQMFLDGEPVAMLPNGVTLYQTPALAVGAHDVEAIAIDEESTPYGGLTGSALGRRVRLLWGRATAADLGSYLVQQNVSSVWTTIETLSVVDFADIRSATGGVGTGRMTLQGTWTGGTFNGTLAAVWTAPDQIAFDGVTYTLEGPGFYTLTRGVEIEVLDPLASYSTGDTWTLTIGPATTYTTGELDSGTQQFRVIAVDVAGNQSTPSNTLSVSVPTPLEPPTGFSATVDGTTLTVAADSPVSGTQTRIYSNLNPSLGTIEEYVNEITPIATITGGNLDDDFDITGINGKLLFYARSVRTSDGVEEDNCTLFRLTVGTQVTIDYAPPTLLVGRPGAAGVAVLTWIYQVRDGLAPSRFAVYQFTSAPTAEEVDAASPLATVSYTTGNQTTYSYTTAALAGQRWFVVRAQNSSGVGERNAVSVSVTPDSTAPTVGTLEGGLVP